MIKVIDDIVDIFDQEIIKHQVLTESYFQYCSDISYKGNERQRRPGFKHVFDLDILHDSIKLIVNNCNKKIGRKPINVSDPLVGDKIIEARSFLQLPLNTDFTGTGVDSPHLDRFTPHLVFLYYVCDSDGDTIIYDYKTEKEGDVPFFEDVKELKRITPKQGRVVIFDGMYWHTAEQPKKDVRCILNFNISSNGT